MVSLWHCDLFYRPLLPGTPSNMMKNIISAPLGPVSKEVAEVGVEWLGGLYDAAGLVVFAGDRSNHRAAFWTYSLVVMRAMIYCLRGARMADTTISLPEPRGEAPSIPETIPHYRQPLSFGYALGHSRHSQDRPLANRWRDTHRKCHGL